MANALFNKTYGSGKVKLAPSDVPNDNVYRQYGRSNADSALEEQKQTQVKEKLLDQGSRANAVASQVVQTQQSQPGPKRNILQKVGNAISAPGRAIADKLYEPLEKQQNKAADQAVNQEWTLGLPNTTPSEATGNTSQVVSTTNLPGKVKSLGNSIISAPVGLAKDTNKELIQPAYEQTKQIVQHPSALIKGTPTGRQAEDYSKTYDSAIKSGKIDKKVVGSLPLDNGTRAMLGKIISAGGGNKEVAAALQKSRAEQNEKTIKIGSEIVGTGALVSGGGEAASLIKGGEAATEEAVPSIVKRAAGAVKSLSPVAENAAVTNAATTLQDNPNASGKDIIKSAGTGYIGGLVLGGASKVLGETINKLGVNSRFNDYLSQYVTNQSAVNSDLAEKSAANYSKGMSRLDTAEGKARAEAKASADLTPSSQKALPAGESQKLLGAPKNDFVIQSAEDKRIAEGTEKLARDYTKDYKKTVETWGGSPKRLQAEVNNLDSTYIAKHEALLDDVGGASTAVPRAKGALKPLSRENLPPIDLPPGIAHPSDIKAPAVQSMETPEAIKTDQQPQIGDEKLQAETAKPKATGTITVYSGHQGQGSPFSTSDKQFATEKFANEDSNGNAVKGIVETKKLDKADILDTRNAGDRAALESVLGKENVQKLVDSSGNGLPAHMDKGEQNALIKAADQLGYKHIALSETDNLTKYNGKDVISYADTTGEAPKISPTEPVVPASTPAPTTKTSKLGASIEAKAVENKLTTGFEGTAGYDPVTVKEQAQLSTDLISSNPERARRIINGVEELPKDLRAASLVTAMEEHALNTRDTKLLQELANSPLVAETSRHAQELRLLAEREPDSVVTQMRAVAEAKKAAFEAKTKTTLSKAQDKVTQSIKANIKKPNKTDWNIFTESILCK